ncbi:hypothetical protein CES86_0848 [Brucella lupini]|uniref:Uncharacterized protein n=1 Tax=Brucella lupini TaxID=255457 RepID=A0A256GX59_9HYPH|nr:hypothetical protein CES86_0848 [Brucella lupini]
MFLYSSRYLLKLGFPARKPDNAQGALHSIDWMAKPRRFK